MDTRKGGGEARKAAATAPQVGAEALQVPEDEEAKEGKVVKEVGGAQVPQRLLPPRLRLSALAVPNLAMRLLSVGLPFIWMAPSLPPPGHALFQTNLRAGK